eukprot:TRINITY_DN7615_c0_g1_i10.p1 TRINITY_DN7615_c0_g1~~TRINITY_DN7615_c0_g1_i10.p1  ORF type:complete len:128 (+),score=8.25 TRINITY_DN7615_c0_g1_i10:326-709(+)
MIINMDSWINVHMNPVLGILIWCSTDVAVDSALDSCQPLTVCVCVCVGSQRYRSHTSTCVGWVESKNKKHRNMVRGFICILIFILMLFLIHVVVVDDLKSIKACWGKTIFDFEHLTGTESKCCADTI